MITLSDSDTMLLHRAEALLRSPEKVAAVHATGLLKIIDRQVRSVRCRQDQAPTRINKVWVRLTLLQLTYNVKLIEGLLE